MANKSNLEIPRDQIVIPILNKKALGMTNKEMELLQKT